MRTLFALTLTAAAAATLLTTSSVRAAEYVCPDLSQAVPLGECANAQQLEYTYAGYCSDDKRIYDKDDGDICVTLENYKKIKDNVLWEAGAFQGYQHCGTPQSSIAAAKPTGVKIAASGKITRLICSYDGANDMVLRLRGQCRLDGDKAVCDD
jgi:hypothetical protein